MNKERPKKARKHTAVFAVMAMIYPENDLTDLKADMEEFLALQGAEALIISWGENPSKPFADVIHILEKLTEIQKNNDDFANVPRETSWC